MASNASKANATKMQDVAPTATLNIATRKGETAPKIATIPTADIQSVFPSIFLALSDEVESDQNDGVESDRGAESPSEARELIRVSAEQIGLYRLDKIVVSKRGFFTLIDGEDEVTLGEQLQAYVMGQVTQRSFYHKPFDANATAEAPDCSSRDGGVTGVGEFGLGSDENPTGRCDQCPMSKWHGKDKPLCRERLTLFLLVVDDQDNVMPATMTLSPTSLAPWRDYTRTLLTKQRVPLGSVITEFRIDEVKKGGNSWYVTRAQAAGKLEADAAATLTRYAEEMVAILHIPVVKTAADGAPQPTAIAGSSTLMKALPAPQADEDAETEETEDTEENEEVA